MYSQKLANRLKAIAAGLLVAGVVIQAAWAQTDPTLEALAQYVREARKSGLTDPQIESSAEKAGWDKPAILQAIAEVNAGKTHATNDAKGSSGETAADRANLAVADPSANGVPHPVAKPAQDSPKTDPNVSVAAPPDKNRNVSDEYEIGAGDVIQISVWKEPDASVPSTVVRTDGKISMPLLKEIEIAGMTPPQAEKMITAELSKYITAPDVTVVVSAIHSKKIFVNGAVKKEGPIAYTYRMTILQALSEAGGLTDYAKRKKIYVLHNEGGRQFKLDFDYDAVLKGLKLEQNIYLTPGDTVVVPH